MTDVDQWIEIAKDCKYLPENDLKVIFNSEIENITRPTVRPCISYRCPIY